MLFLWGVTLKAQPGSTCATAITLTPSTVCSPTAFTSCTCGTSMYFTFVATSPTVNIAVSATKFGVDAPHIHHIALLAGLCGSSIVLAEDELPFDFNADKLSIDLNASALVIGTTYYLKVDREATHMVCDKAGCRAVGSTAPATFNICIENINVIIPADFGLELPSTSNSYQTNRGQIVDMAGNKRPDIKLFTSHTNPAIYVGEDAISYVFYNIDTIPITVDSIHRVDLKLVGSNSGRKIFKTEELAGVSNYYLPQTPYGSTNNKDYYRTVTTDIYPNIDMQWYSNSKGEKIYFIVKPGGDADNIILKFDGATSVVALADGSLKVTTPLGNIVYEAPHAYQINPAGHVVPMPWQANFLQVTSNSVKFDIRSYPHIMPLFIQVDKGHAAPASGLAIDNLTWSTYYAGAGMDVAYDVTTDAAKSVYVVGTTQSNHLSFPLSPGPFQGVLNAGQDAFVLKFDYGATRIFGTYYGGNNYDQGYGIAIGSTQNLYITGTTGSSSLPIIPTNNGIYIQSAGHSNYNGYVAEFDAALGTVLWETFYGGNAQVKGYKLAIDNANNVFVTGRVKWTSSMATATGGIVPAGGASGGFPLLGIGGAYIDNAFNYGTLGTSDHDAFIAKFTPSNQLEWSTIFGGNNMDDSREIAIDPTNQDVVITGNTDTQLPGDILCGVPTNGGFPLCNSNGVSYFQDTYNAGGAFIARFANNGRLKWSTYFDGRSGGLIFNSTGELYISGITQNNISSNSTVAPTNNGHPVFNTGGAYTQGNAGSNDAYINKFDKSNKMLWGSFYGGSTDEGILTPYNELGYTDLAKDNSDNIYMTGASHLVFSGFNDFPTLLYPTYYFTQYNQPIDDIHSSFIVVFNPTNQRKWATLYGGTGTGTSNDGNDNGLAIATAGYSLYVTGFTYSTNFPYTCPSPVTGTPYCQNYTAPENFDAFLGRFDITLLVGIMESVQTTYNLLVYPNPSSDDLNLEFEMQDKGNVKIAVHNVVGQIVYAEQLQNYFGSYKKKINLENFTKGMYVITMEFVDGTVAQKFIKQ